MKIIITESQYKLIKEVSKTVHFDERMIERMYFDIYEVVFVGSFNGNRIKRVVGQYRLTDEARNKIREKIDTLSKMDFPVDQNIGFILHHFDINGPDDIIMDNQHDREWLRRIIKLNDNPLFFVLDPTKDYDDYSLVQVAMAVIKENKFITVMYKNLLKLTPKHTGDFDYIGDDIDDLKRHYNIT